MTGTNVYLITDQALYPMGTADGLFIHCPEGRDVPAHFQDLVFGGMALRTIWEEAPIDSAATIASSIIEYLYSVFLLDGQIIGVSTQPNADADYGSIIVDIPNQALWYCPLGQESDPDSWADKMTLADVIEATEMIWPAAMRPESER